MRPCYSWQPVGMMYSVQRFTYPTGWRQLGREAFIAADDFGNFFLLNDKLEGGAG